MRHQNLTVADLMTTAVVTVKASQTLEEASATMHAGVFRHLPVVDARGKLVGILSDRDLLRAQGRPKGTIIAEVMTRDLISVTADTPAHVAARAMLDDKIGSVPVLGEDGHLVGLLTETDFLEVARRALLGLPLGV